MLMNIQIRSDNLHFFINHRHINTEAENQHCTANAYKHNSYHTFDQIIDNFPKIIKSKARLRCLSSKPQHVLLSYDKCIKHAKPNLDTEINTLNLPNIKSNCRQFSTNHNQNDSKKKLITLRRANWEAARGEFARSSLRDSRGLRVEDKMEEGDEEA